MKSDKALLRDSLGTIEDIVEDARLVDGAKGVFETLILNAPTFSPERRRFLESAATASAGAGLWLVKMGGAPTAGALISTLFPDKARADREGRDEFTSEIQEEPVPHANPGWKAYLLSQDLVFGPKLSWKSDTGFRDFQSHLKHSRLTKPIGAVDYEVPIGVPVVPAKSGYANAFTGKFGGISLNVFQLDRLGFYSHLNFYSHLHSYSINIGPSLDNWNKRLKKNSVDLTTIMAYSGYSGTPWAHLHFAIQKKVKGKYVRPGIDPFTTGIDGGRPLYHDGETKIADPSNSFTLYAELARLDEKLRTTSSEELGVDNQIVADLKARLNGQDIGSLQDYLRHQVLKKHLDGSGRENYRFLPGSFMYSLMLTFVRKPGQEFIMMLPFINPHVVDSYSKRNPGIDL